MEISAIAFGITDWSAVEKEEHRGESGMAYWRTQKFGSIRVPHRSCTEVGAKLFVVD